MRRLSILTVSLLAGLGAVWWPVNPSAAAASPVPVCECLPTEAGMAAGFDMAGIGRLGPGYPSLPRIGVDSAIVPPALLKAVGWVESNWRQFDTSNLPLLSPDFGYGIMQITSGMAGSAGDPTGDGTLPVTTQDHIGGSYLFNIAFGARMLAQLFNSSPAINHRDPTILEDWYYALWAYNGWGWVNNPNNPAYSRQGTPATNPSGFPYQERVYYLVEHPPLDASGHPMWTPMQVTMPPASEIGQDPGNLNVGPVHHEIPHVYGATYDIPSGLTAMHAGSSVAVHVRAYNTSGIPWTHVDASPAFALMYHWVRFGHAHSAQYDPNLHGIDVQDGPPVAIPDEVLVGGTVRFAVRLKAPASPGNYVLEWDMWSKQSGWFSYNSVPPALQSIRVAPSGESVPPYTDPPDASYIQGYHSWFVTYTAGPAPAAMAPREAYSESVLLFNPGSRGWGTRFRLRLVCSGAPCSDAPAGTPKAVKLPVPFVASCRTVPVTISDRAPSTPGSYSFVWRLETPDGELFGNPIRLKFTVSSGEQRRYGGLENRQPLDIIGHAANGRSARPSRP